MMHITGVQPELTAKITCGVAVPIGIGIIVWGGVQFQASSWGGWWLTHSFWQVSSIATWTAVARVHSQRRCSAVHVCPCRVCCALFPFAW